MSTIYEATIWNRFRDWLATRWGIGTSPFMQRGIKIIWENGLPSKECICNEQITSDLGVCIICGKRLND